MESPREHPPPANPPSTPKAEAPVEERRPPRAQRRAREVSSRYMMAVASPSAHPPTAAPSSSTSDQSAAAPSSATFQLPPPWKPHPKPKHHHPLFSSAAGAATPASAAEAERARARRSPSPRTRHHPAALPSSEVGDSDTEGSSFGDENRPQSSTVLSRSTETPFPPGAQGKVPATQRRRVVRLFREIAGEQPPPPPPQLPPPPEHQKPTDSKFLVRKPRPGTPVVHLPERAALLPPTETQNLTRPANGRPLPRRTSTQVSRSLQDSLTGSSQQRAPATPLPSDHESNSRSANTSPENSVATDFSEAETCSISSPGGLCDSPPIHGQSSRRRVSSECRSSMPEADLLPTMSSRLLTEGNSHQLEPISSSSFRGLSSSLCHRSLNSALSSCQQRQPNPAMSVGRLPTPMRAHSSSLRVDAGCLLQPPNGKMAAEPRKGRKMSNRQEDAHALRLLENQHLQWRFVNANAQAAVQSRRAVAERSLYGVSAKLSELHDSVTSKSIELGQLKRTRVVSSILEAQMPYLVEWAHLEDDHSHSLSGAIKSLYDASLRLPIIGNVRADIRELGEVLDSATNVLEGLAPRVGCLVPKSDGMQNVLSDLAKVVNDERALIEEFGDLLAEAHKMQVNECSLRVHLIQLKRINSVQTCAES